MSQPADSPPAIVVVIPTHTARRLDAVLAALTRQTRAPDAIVVSCDTDDPAIGRVLIGAATLGRCPLHWVRRAAHGVERLSQVRNNAARYVAHDLGLRRAHLLVLDGDMLASSGLVAAHAERAQRHALVLAQRVNLTPDDSASAVADVLAGRELPAPSERQLAELRRRERRARTHLFLRRLRLAPLHKPRLLGGHFSVSLELYLRLNGFDEEYQGWGFKDDEFARRAARLGVRPDIAIRSIPAFHLHHATRQPPGRMADLPTYRRFARSDLPILATHGVENPLPQHPVVASAVKP